MQKAPNRKEVEEVLEKMVSPELSMMGFDLIEIEFSGNNLRLVIDKPGGVSMDDCVAVTRRIGLVLDAEDPIDGPYTLEVSSPGLTRRLKSPREYDHFSGRVVKIQTKERTIRGILRGHSGDGVMVEVGDEKVIVKEGDIVKANLDF